MDGTLDALHLEILTKDLGVFLPEATGLPDSIQAVRIRVRSREATAVHVVAKACEAPFVLGASVEDVCALFPGEVVSVIVREDGSAAKINCAERSEATLFAAAAATATLMRAWGWNESPSILVDVGEGNAAFELEPVFAASEWIVERVNVQPFP